MKVKPVKQFRIPGWLFLTGMSLYVELLLYIWTGDGFVAGRLAAIMVFGLAFGSCMGLITSFLKPKAEKWTAVALAFLLAVFCLVEYFLNDAFRYFMPLISIFTTAGNVAAGFSGTILSVVLRNLWRIALVLLPIALYVLFSCGSGPSRKRSLALALAAGVLYAGGMGLVHLADLDTAHLSSAAKFDGRVRSFGLSMGTLMDLTGGAGQGSADFEIIDIPQPTVETAAPTEETAGPTEETAAPTEPPKVYAPHSFDLDFLALAESENRPDVANVHRYLASLTPDMENDYTGLFAGKNLIFITAEAFSAEVVDQELTPTLYRMANEGIRFTDYYQPVWGCGTIGGEFANLLGLVPFNGTNVMMEVVEQDMFLTMGKQLRKQGYVSGAYHNNDYYFYNRVNTHTSLGYDKFVAVGSGLEGYLSGSGWPKSDLEMFDATIPEYLEQDRPFSLYYMTVSGHSPYSEGNMVARKNYALVKDLPYSEQVKYYLAANLELEFAMASLLRQLEEAGIADETVIVISPDHYPYGLDGGSTWGGENHTGELKGDVRMTDQNRDRNCLIIWSGCVEDMDIVVEDPVSALDILPTLSNLFGLEYDSRLLIGRDVFSDSDPLVFWPLTYSWKTDKGSYDGTTKTFSPAEGVEVGEDYVKAVSAAVKNKIIYSRSVQSYDYFNMISKLLRPAEPTE